VPRVRESRWQSTLIRDIKRLQQEELHCHCHQVVTIVDPAFGEDLVPIMRGAEQPEDA
jgi:hypothetical protein